MTRTILLPRFLAGVSCVGICAMHIISYNVYSSQGFLEHIMPSDHNKQNSRSPTCDLQRITGYLAEAYIETHKVQFGSTW